MGSGIIDVPNPFQAMLDVRLSSQGGNAVDRALANAAAIQEFESREIHTDTQRVALEKMRDGIARQKKHDDAVRLGVTTNFTASYAAPANTHIQGKQYGAAMMYLDQARNFFSMNGSENTDEARGKLWVASAAPEIGTAMAAMTEGFSNTYIDMRDVYGQNYSGPKPKRSLTELGTMAADDIHVARWAVQKSPENMRAAVAQQFGWGYERDLGGNINLYKEGSLAYRGWKVREERVLNYYNLGLPMPEARHAVMSEYEANRAWAARVEDAARKQNIPFNLAEDQLLQQIKTTHWTTQYRLWQTANPGASASEHASARFGYQLNNGILDAEDVPGVLANIGNIADAESAARFAALDPAQREYINLSRRYAFAKTLDDNRTSVVTNPGSLDAAEISDATSSNIVVRDTLRGAIRGKAPGDLVASKADRVHDRKLAVLMGALGDPNHQKAYKSKDTTRDVGLRTAAMMLNPAGAFLGRQAGRYLGGSTRASHAEAKEKADNVAHLISRIGETEASIQAAKERGLFARLEAELGYFGLGKRDMDKMLGALATPEQTLAKTVKTEELPEVAELRTQINTLFNDMTLRGLPVPGSVEFRALQMGASGSAAVQAGLTEASAEAAASTAKTDAIERVMKQMNEAQDRQAQHAEFLRKLLKDDSLSEKDAEEVRAYLGQVALNFGIMPNDSLSGRTIGPPGVPDDRAAEAAKLGITTAQ